MGYSNYGYGPPHMMPPHHHMGHHGDMEWVMGVAEAEEWCRSVLVIGSAGLKGADITISPRTSAAFVVELAVLGQQL